MIKMHTGLLRHRVTFQKVTKGDDYETVDSWADYVRVYAGILPKQGTEIVEEDQVKGKTPCQFVIRHRTDITDAMRLVHNGEILDILNVYNDEQRDRWLVIEAVSVGRTTSGSVYTDQHDEQYGSGRKTHFNVYDGTYA